MVGKMKRVYMAYNGVREGDADDNSHDLHCIPVEKISCRLLLPATQLNTLYLLWIALD